MADRTLYYFNEVPYAEDILSANKDSYVGLGRYIDAVLGDTTQLNGFGCIPSTPPALTVDVEPGEIYVLAQTDPIPYGLAPADLPVDTRLLMKQGILLDKITLSTPAPTTPGNSINYLVQIVYQQVDGVPLNRNFYQAVPQTVNTQRQDLAVVNVKAGVEAPTGTQATPTPDPFYTGAWVVTVTYGQTTVTAPDITMYPSAPFIISKLKDKISQAEGDARYAIKAQTNIFGAYQVIPQLYAQVTFNAGVQQNIANGASNKIQFNHVLYDSNSWWDGTNYWFAPGKAGKYRVTSIVHRITPDASNYIISVYVNNVFVCRIGEAFDPTTSTTTFGSMIISLANNSDTVHLNCFNNSPVNIDIGADIVGTGENAVTNLFELHYLGD